MLAPTARWIWLADAPAPLNQYVCFRRTFTLDAAPATAELRLAVDADYQLFVNGVELYGRQYSDYPHCRSVNVHRLDNLRSGPNTIAILAWHRGESSSDHRAGQPGLIVDLHDGDRLLLVSDAAWRARLAPAWTHGRVPRVSPQMSFTVEYDARLEDAWTGPGYDDSAWVPAADLAGPTDGYWALLQPRPLPFLVVDPPLASTLVRTGPLADVPAGLSAARTIDGSRRLDTPADPAQSFFAIYDLGHEEVGLLELDVEAPAGTVVDVAHGEHLDDGHVRALIGSREFGDRFHCADGLNRFRIPFRRLGCRYLEIHCREQSGPAVIHRATLAPTRYPLPAAASLELPDDTLAALDRVGRRTVELCMHEHYEDCPWREQSLYAYDSRNQALYTYYAWGEYDLPAQSFRLLGQSLRDDGLLELCAPATVPVSIPIFSLVWICAVHEHCLFSGSLDLYRDMAPVIDRILDTFHRRVDPATGLAKAIVGNQYWPFYEWAPGLSGSFRTDDDDRVDAPHNLYLAEAMDAAAALREAAGQAPGPWRRRADAIRRAVAQAYWDPARGTYWTYRTDGQPWHRAEATQALAEYHRLPGVPTEVPGDHGLVPITLSTMPYAAMAAWGAPADRQIRLLDWVRRVYGGMLDRGATSLWETALGADDFGGAGSLCHGWSALPVWIARAYVLGIRPTAPGFARFDLTPHLAGLDHAAGAVPTPHGPIHVEWRRAGDECRVRLRAPAACAVDFRPIPQTGLRYLLETS